MFGDLVHKAAADVKKMSTFTAFKMVMHMAGILCSDILIAAWAALFDCIFSDFQDNDRPLILIRGYSVPSEKSGYPLPLHAVLSFPEKKLLSVPSASSGIHYSQSFHFSVSSIVRQNMPVLIFQDLSDPEPPLFRAPNAWQESEYRHPHCA